jgi:hypothetical protein
MQLFPLGDGGFLAGLRRIAAPVATELKAKQDNLATTRLREAEW